MVITKIEVSNIRKIKRLPKKIRAVDFGSGDAEWILEQARIKRKEKYLAVDEKYNSRTKSKAKNLTILPSNINNAIKILKKEGKKIKYATIRMPVPAYVSIKHINLEKILLELRDILEKNGSIIITTEADEVRRQIETPFIRTHYNIKKREITVPKTYFERRFFYNNRELTLYRLTKIK